MTARELYLGARTRLAEAGVEDPGFDAAALSARFLGLDRRGLALHGDEVPAEERQRAFLGAAAQRAGRRPLQYILGSWPFMGMELKVGEGVLIPREDTAVLVEAVAARLERGGRGLDLCAGTGAVGLGLCSLLPGTEVLCVEVDESAMGYLRENVAKYPEYRCRTVRGDVLAGPEPGSFRGGLDFIASNPPYIAGDELPTLQPEVRWEPALALDGGRDGLRFYRAILERWAGLLRPGGVLGVEIGETQGREVAEMFGRGGFADITVHKDLAGLDRAVTGIRKS